MATSLRDAATRGDLPEVRARLAAEPPSREALQSALISAIIFGHFEVVEALFDAGADANYLGESGPPLFFAVTSSLAMTRLLLARGADVRWVDLEGRDALHVYLSSLAPGQKRVPGDGDLVKTLLAAGLSLRREGARSHLALACWSGDASLVTLLLDAGLDPDERGTGEEDHLWKALSTPMGEAVLGALVDGGLDANARCTNASMDLTVLMAVCRNGDLERARRLLAAGADPNARGHGTPLTCAEESGNQVLVDLLLEHGAQPLRRNLDPATLRQLDETEQAARAHPTSVALRLRWAQQLASAGFRAAAQLESQRVARLGGDVSALQASLEFEKPAGTRWRFEPFDDASMEVTAPIADARFPRALVTTGAHTLPLALTLGPVCTRCDARGETECSMCGGTGRYSSFLSEADVPCEPRQICTACRGLKFVVMRKPFAAGRCAHVKKVTEATVAGMRFCRCASCGLPALESNFGGATTVFARYACAICEQFACTCRERAG